MLPLLKVPWCGFIHFCLAKWCSLKKGLRWEPPLLSLVTHRFRKQWEKMNTSPVHFSLRSTCCETRIWFELEHSLCFLSLSERAAKPWRSRLGWRQWKSHGVWFSSMEEQPHTGASCQKWTAHHRWLSAWTSRQEPYPEALRETDMLRKAQLECQGWLHTHRDIWLDIVYLLSRRHKALHGRD